MSKSYSIAFEGEIAEGFDTGDVKASFAQNFRKGDDVIERLFSGNTVTLARNLEPPRQMPKTTIRIPMT
ncbi:MAG: hypothetical protein ACE5F8_03780 [Woeseiaceae bacterium]